jgi:leucyl-tRNA synthetase
MDKYNPSEIEAKWQKAWEESKPNKVNENSVKPKRYILDMFPYPSGAGLHVGHVESYTATDIYARYTRMKGFEVLHPQGWDAFGLPAENYAIKTGIHPAETTKKAVETFKRQMDSLGLSYDWSREVNSSEPAYYKWTQWLFLLFYKNGLAYKKLAKTNWCSSCQTVLANEQVVNGNCERCGTAVMQKDLEQWFFKITDFIEDQVVEGPSTGSGQGKTVKGLLSGLGDVDWPESTKLAQKNWIGRSEGAAVKFNIVILNEPRTRSGGSEESMMGGFKKYNRSFANAQDDKIFLEVFTTRPDTLFGCTYMVVCPEHPIISEQRTVISNQEEIQKYIEASKRKTDLERTDLNKDKSGVRLEGLSAINPVNGQEIPVFVADYVLSGYGTGAIMAVPAHDQRDWEFAKKYGLPIIEVVKGGSVEAEAYEDDGVNINSDFLDGLATAEAKEKMIGWLEEKGIGKRAINYRIRDWLVSRQRYWGAPIPIIYCLKCTSAGSAQAGMVPVPESDLPVLLPGDVAIKPTGESPLVYSAKFQDVKCPHCGEPARREADTMDTFVCSSWYYLRYADPHNDSEFAGAAQLKKWLPVDLYVGGAEHSVLHLLYSRFFTKVLQKYGYLEFNEPFLKLRHQGIILAGDGNKMSKSKGNVVNPDEVVAKEGADSLRLYEMFMGPLEDMKPWNTESISGVRRFLEKTWKTILSDNFGSSASGLKNDDQALYRLINRAIKKVGEDIESLKFNTAISEMMKTLNELKNLTSKAGITPAAEDFFKKNFLIILAPFAPHLAEELWFRLGSRESIFAEAWPGFDPNLTKEEVFRLVIQVNGKVRDSVEVSADINEAEANRLVRENEKLKKWLAGKEVIKVIFIPGKLINVVVKDT